LARKMDNLPITPIRQTWLTRHMPAQRMAEGWPKAGRKPAP
jgi:hypothetical protein